MKKVKKIIQNLFTHDCENNKEAISKILHKDRSTGLYFSVIKNFKCKKCGKKWTE